MASSPKAAIPCSSKAAERLSVKVAGNRRQIRGKELFVDAIVAHGQVLAGRGENRGSSGLVTHTPRFHTR